MWRRPVRALLGLALALGPGTATPAAADGCAAVCAEPGSEPACQAGRAVWGFREPGGACRGGSFGYLESREGAEAERRRLARAEKLRCDESGDCARFEALDAAEPVCLACPGGDSATALDASLAGGKAPPCAEDEWLRAATAREPARCFVEFAALPPRIALEGHCSDGDCRSGSGILEWPTGESYAGAFRGGMRHGQGSFRWPDGRAYVGEWRDGQPSGLGTRIFADGRFKAGYFQRGRYLGPDLAAWQSANEQARREHPGAPRSHAPTRSCEEACTEDADLYLSRINDEFECCFARHAFCRQKGEIALEDCTTPACAQAARAQQDACDLRYACDAVQTQKVARFRRERAACVEGCSSQELDEHGLRISERGTLLDDD